jgi:hypothetical protein
MPCPSSVSPQQLPAQSELYRQVAVQRVPMSEKVTQRASGKSQQSPFTLHVSVVGEHSPPEDSLPVSLSLEQLVIERTRAPTTAKSVERNRFMSGLEKRKNGSPLQSRLLDAERVDRT